VYAVGADEQASLEQQAASRYTLEPYIHAFARFHEGLGRDVLEIGVGMGADHLEWAKSQPRSLTGIDLTPRAIAYCRARLQAWGVLHHTPNTSKAVDEIRRVLRPGGTARVMMYHKYSIVGDMLWLRYALLTGKPGRTLKNIYAQHLESHGTQAFTVDEARTMFAGFRHVKVLSQLSFGDLLQGAVGQRHPSRLLTVTKALWPRAAIKALFPRRGLMLLIEATK
jgi:SAM-dependent methyltransferase